MSMQPVVMLLVALQQPADSPGPIGELAQTFGVNWPHLLAQIASFTIVCALLYLLAYTPILKMLEARREQIAGGLANAEQIKARLDRIEGERVDILARAEEAGKRLIAEARAAAARVEAEETRKATASAEQIVQRAHEAATRDYERMREELRGEIGRLVVQTTAAVTGRILTAEDHERLSREAAQALAS
jgi:F-type H+-transporting ATPase subunit b